MLYYLFLALLCWVGWGALVATIKVFVYFRGPKHMIDLYLTNPATEEFAKVITKDLKESDYWLIYVSLLVLSMIVPFRTTLDLINDIYLFSWVPFFQGDQKKDRH